ncbi:insulin receptor-like [Xenia sp. Carnegie-2017]|uniref:insulin receptor-like n=1 Tax=Xenia sp. Carnegie-2017 TaxID=2897299 RepID=UPI001F048AC0|nr:insulin receptor-like [Xenia sp. Carnegie-2017]
MLDKVIAIASSLFVVEALLQANPDITSDAYHVCTEKIISVMTTSHKEGNKTIYSCIGCKKLRRCTSVYGSVHLKKIAISSKNEFLSEQLRFPKLREITGHLIVTFLLQGVYSLSNILPNLAVIRGRLEDLFQGYALVVYQNDALLNLGLDSLTTIQQGGVRIEHNDRLCFLNQVRWKSVMQNGESKKYDLVKKDNSGDCFMTCSHRCHTPSGHGLSGNKYCWGRYRKNCQKLCDQRCGYNGCEKDTTDRCCHSQCLGGCTQANSPHHCYACRSLRLENGSCVPNCPLGLKEVHNFICEKKCRQDGKYELHGKCYKKCPIGFKEDDDKEMCIKCHGCPNELNLLMTKYIPTLKINSLAKSAELKGYTILTGNLEIEIKNVPGTKNIAGVLKEHMGSLRVINGYLLIRQSTPLISLNFLRNLTRINVQRNGFTLKNYALAIFDNPNLMSLWDFHPNFTIAGSKNGVFIQLNPRLCPYTIDPLVKDVLKRNYSDRSVDVSKTTNGNSITCDVLFVNLTVTSARCSICVRVSWPNVVSREDYRNVVLYSIWYRETTRTDLREYDDIDACNSDHVWSHKDVLASRRRTGGPVISDVLHSLKAYTLYAFRVEALVIAGPGVKSHITYFKTRETKPSTPQDLEANYLTSSSLQLKWRKPFYPNGNLTHYVIRYHEIIVNYGTEDNDLCKSHVSIQNQDKKTLSKDEPNNNTCPVNKTCNCLNEEVGEVNPDLEEALFAKQFQDTILSTVFVKRDKKDDDDDDKDKDKNRIKDGKNTSKTTSSPHQEIATKSGYQDCDKKLGHKECYGENVYCFCVTVMNTTSLPPTEPAITTVTTTKQMIELHNLKHFTTYSFEVCACNAGAGCSKNEGFRKQCATATGRTDKDVNADSVGDTLTFSASNKTKQFTLRWQAPPNPNGIVFNYDLAIMYKNHKNNYTKNESHCILASETEYSKTDASVGEYWVRVRANTLAGQGLWTEWVNFVIVNIIKNPVKPVASKDANITTVIGVSVTAVVIFAIVFAVLTYSLIRRHKKNISGVLFSSTNPEYWNCSEVYVPDEWEVPRKNITLIRELGNGSFGMVWEGEAVDILPGVPCCKVAVKTVSANSSIRDKVEFLKEASIMKAFHCNHVVQLLGVVSDGDPVLVMMELMENGDLKGFLRKRRPDTEEEPLLHPPTEFELYQMAAEIADGMAYLSDRKFVHRDLAARNCMVSGNYVCKIGDFGMARDVYETDYYRKGGKGFLPVRWMAPESLKDGVFCSASDVWSYGVVLWEMATLAEQPYQGKSNEEVMRFVLDGNTMEIPSSFPKNLTEIILSCWEYKDKNRLSFFSIVEKLERFLSIEFTERSFYHDKGLRRNTDSCSLISSATENGNMDVFVQLSSPTNDKESFV